MPSDLSTPYRSHTCGQLRAADPHDHDAVPGPRAREQPHPDGDPNGPGDREGRHAQALQPEHHDREHGCCARAHADTDDVGGGEVTPSARISRATSSRPAKRQAMAPREARPMKAQAVLPEPPRAAVPKSIAAKTR